MSNTVPVKAALAKQARAAQQSITKGGSMQLDGWVSFGLVMQGYKAIAGDNNQEFNEMVVENKLDQTPTHDRNQRAASMWLAKYRDRVDAVAYKDMQRTDPNNYRQAWRKWLMLQVMERQAENPKAKVTDIVQAILGTNHKKTPTKSGDDFYAETYQYVANQLEKAKKKAEAAKQAAEDAPGEPISDAPVSQDPGNEDDFWTLFESLRDRANQFGVELSASDAGAMDRRRKKGGNVKKAAAVAAAAVKSVSRDEQAAVFKAMSKAANLVIGVRLVDDRAEPEEAGEVSLLGKAEGTLPNVSLNFKLSDMLFDGGHLFIRKNISELRRTASTVEMFAEGDDKDERKVKADTAHLVAVDRLVG